MKRGAGDTVLPCHCSSEQRGHIWREREGRLGHKGQLGIGNWPCKAHLPLEETGTRESCEQSRALPNERGALFRSGDRNGIVIWGL